MTAPLLDIRSLNVGFAMGDDIVPTLRNLSLAVQAGETLGIVGESGSGKSLTARAIMGLLPANARRSAGSILLHTRSGDVVDLATLPQTGWQLRALRAREMAMIFQEPMASLSPVHTIGDQIATPTREHLRLSRRAAWAQAVDWLAHVGMPSPAHIAEQYPHQISGGMRQRAMIAIALCCEPRLLICDEPTTALDVTTEAQIVDLLERLRAELGMGMVFISHNVALVSEIADRVAVMYLGEAVETGTRMDVLGAAAHPYTEGLLRSIPANASPGTRIETLPGTVPELIARPSGCSFSDRCSRAISGLCERVAPDRYVLSPTQTSKCHLHA